MNDSISRKAALDTYSELYRVDERLMNFKDKLHEVFVKLCNLPSADVRENVRGKWIEPQREGCVSWDKRAYAQCSICGYKQYFGREKNFCPNCGADMRGDTE